MGVQRQEVSTTSIPEYARPYIESMLGQAWSVANQEYRPYPADRERIAGFSPLQQAVQAQAAGYQLPGQTGQASQMAADIATQAQQAGQYTPGEYGNQFQAPDAYQTGQFYAPQLQQYQMQGPQNVGTQSFLQPGAAQAYMSPYMQNVVDVQKREAARQSGIMQQQQQAQMAQAGAYGGSRQAIIEAERQRNLGTQLGDIQATGSQAAFQNAQQQFNAEQAARLQADLANQQAGYNVGAQNLAARLGVQQLGSQNAMDMQRMLEQSRQFGANQGMTAAQLRAQYGLSGQQLSEQSRQFGANLGIQGLQQQLAAAGLLGNLGQQQYGQEMGLMNFQNQLGGQQQALQQAIDTQQYQDFLNQRGWQQQQLAWFGDLTRGLPLSQTTKSLYTAPPSPWAQAAGTAAAIYGANYGNGGGGGGSSGYGYGGYARGGLTSLVANKLMQG